MARIWNWLAERPMTEHDAGMLASRACLRLGLLEAEEVREFGQWLRRERPRMGARGAERRVRDLVQEFRGEPREGAWRRAGRSVGELLEGLGALFSFGLCVVVVLLVARWVIQFLLG